MGKLNPVFKKNFENYLQQLADVNFSQLDSILGITVDLEEKTAEIPFFQTLYRVSPSGVCDDQGKSPDYGTCVILLKYLLMCPKYIPTDKKWNHFRDFKDSVQAQNAGLSDYASMKISELFTGDLDLLKEVISALGAKKPDIDYPYDVSVVFSVLPHIPLLFLFNDKDEHFPAKVSILYESRASHFLDAECRVMVDWHLMEHLKKVRHALVGD